MTDTVPFTTEKAVEIAKSGKPAKMSVYFLHGIYGELPNCNGIAEEVIDTDEKLAKYGLDPKEGGTFIKVWGCSYLYRGNPAMGHVYGMEQAKSMVSAIPREILTRSKLLGFALLLLFLFRRRRFIEYAHVYMESIRNHSIRHYSPPGIRQGRPVREIRRAMDVAIKNEFDIPAEFDLLTALPGYKEYKKMTAALLTKIAAFATLIMEMDCAYRLPLQDILGEVKWENAKQSPIKETMRLFDLMLERQTNLTVVPGISDRYEGIPHKFRFLKKITWLVLLFSPTARRITRTFLTQLDPAKVGLDESDWYYCLRRNTHNYRGVPLPERLKELARIDKEKGHQYIKFQYK